MTDAKKIEALKAINGQISADILIGSLQSELAAMTTRALVAEAQLADMRQIIDRADDTLGEENLDVEG